MFLSKCIIDENYNKKVTDPKNSHKEVSDKKFSLFHVKSGVSNSAPVGPTCRF